jgi:DNA adenine methylase
MSPECPTKQPLLKLPSQKKSSCSALSKASSSLKSRYAVRPEQSSDLVARPFLKWPGGKRWLASVITHYISKRLTGRYFEPFLGGGAVFFALRTQKATLSDINFDLINTYRQVRDNPDALLERLRRKRITANNYYRVRARDPISLLERAVRFLYLNRTAFGGMYRLNADGQFNVPYGGGERTPAALWKHKLIKTASQLLSGVNLMVADFEEMMEQAGSGDVIYCDPTYTVAHENNGFIRYNELNFSWSDQKRLASAARRVIKRGSTVIISNACHDEIRELYWPYKPTKRVRNSLISPEPHFRRQVHEYLFILE